MDDENFRRHTIYGSVRIFLQPDISHNCTMFWMFFVVLTASHFSVFNVVN